MFAQTVKNPPAMQETQIQSLSLENPLEKVMATHSSILAWRRTWIEEPGGLQRVKFQRVRHDGVTNTFTFHCIEYSRTASLFPAQDVQMWMV